MPTQLCFIMAPGEDSCGGVIIEVHGYASKSLHRHMHAGSWHELREAWKSQGCVRPFAPCRQARDPMTHRVYLYSKKGWIYCLIHLEPPSPHGSISSGDLKALDWRTSMRAAGIGMLKGMRIRFVVELAIYACYVVLVACCTCPLLSQTPQAAAYARRSRS